MMTHIASTQIQLPLPGLAAWVGRGGGGRGGGIGPTDEEALHRRLAALFTHPIDLVPTDNRRSLVSWKWLGHDLLQLRVQRNFARADDKVLGALVRFVLHGDSWSRQELRQFALGFQEQLAPPRPRFTHPAGQHYDLRDLLASENRRWFQGSFRGRAGWSLVGKGRVRHRIRLGSWSEEHRLIRIHPVLDSAQVPRHVVSFVVFHEMVHAAVEPVVQDGRRMIHDRKFREFEAVHPDREPAEAWIRDNLDSLLTW